MYNFEKKFVKLCQNHKKKNACFSCFAIKVKKKLRGFSKKLCSRATSRPQLLEAMHEASCRLIPSHSLIILSYCLIIAHRDTQEEEALIQVGKYFHRIMQENTFLSLDCKTPKLIYFPKQAVMKTIMIFVRNPTGICHQYRKIGKYHVSRCVLQLVMFACANINSDNFMFMNAWKSTHNYF